MCDILFFIKSTYRFPNCKPISFNRTNNYLHYKISFEFLCHPVFEIYTFFDPNKKFDILEFLPTILRCSLKFRSPILFKPVPLNWKFNFAYLCIIQTSKSVLRFGIYISKLKHTILLKFQKFHVHVENFEIHHFPDFIQIFNYSQSMENVLIVLYA